MLGSRWFRYFHYRPEKYSKKPRSINYRLAVAGLWTVRYLFAVSTPIFALTYTGLGRDLIGYGDDVIAVFFRSDPHRSYLRRLRVLSNILLVGYKLRGRNSVGCVVWEAFCVAMGACECEFCEFFDFGCCC